jgi:flagellar motor switch protein FliN
MVDIKRFDITTTVTDSLIDVFDMMLSMKLQLSDDDSQTIKDDERIVGSVSIAGRVMGCINIEVSRAFSRIITAAMLDMDISEVEGDNDVKDVIREMCNIVGGNLKSAFCDVGLVCELSPPSFTTGDDFRIKSLNTVRHERYVFFYNSHLIIVEVGIRVCETEEDAGVAMQPFLQRKPIDVRAVEAYDLKTPLTDQAIDVFDTMLSMKLEATDEDLKPSLDGDRLVGAVSFIGSLMGNFSIHVSRNFSLQMTGAMLGIEVDEVEGESDVKDVISELCNIIGGNLKSKFCDSGLVCDLSTPTLTTGKNFRIEAKDMVRYERFSFRYSGVPIVLEVVLKVAENINEDSSFAADSEKHNVPQAHKNVQKQEEESPKAGQTDFGKTDVKGQDLGPVDVGFDDSRLDFILDIPLEVVVELGRNKMKISDLYKIGAGSVVEFANLAGEPLDILVNGTLIAKGEILVRGEKYGVRIMDIMSRMERIRSVL